MIKTNKDLVFCIYSSLWLICNILTAIFSSDVDKGLLYSNNTFICGMAILILVKIYSNKFESWLNKNFKK